MPPVEDHPVHPSTVSAEGSLYGCHSDVRKAPRGSVTHYEGPGGIMIEDTMTAVCMYDKSATDAKCKGCIECK